MRVFGESVIKSSSRYGAVAASPAGADGAATASVSDSEIASETRIYRVSTK